MPVTATFVKTLVGWRGDAWLYRLSEPVGYDAGSGSTEYVVVSAAEVPYSGPETYIFPTDEHGEVASWGEMHGSIRGALDHRAAITEAGWEHA